MSLIDNKSVVLLCQGYNISREPNSLVKLDVRFVLKITPNKSEAIADALRNIEIYLANEVNLVKADSTRKPRCYYCGSLNDESENQCTQCGAPL